MWSKDEMKEFKGRVFATSNDFRDDEYGKFIFRWDDTVKKIDWFCDESEYNPDNWETYGLYAYHPGYTRHQEGDWTVITLI